MSEITLSQIYSLLANSEINEVIATYLFIFISIRLIKYLFDIEVQVLNVDFNKRIFTGAVLGYFVLNITAFPLIDIPGERLSLAFLLISVSILFIFALSIKLFIDQLISPLITLFKTYQVSAKRTKRLRARQSELKHRLQYKKLFDFAAKRFVSHRKDNSKYVLLHLLNFGAATILIIEASILGNELTITACLYSAMFIFLEWKHANLGWFNFGAEINELIKTSNN